MNGFMERGFWIFMSAFRIIVWGILGALLFFVFSTWQEILWGNRFSMAFLDVGQGDAILIKSPQGHQILIDGGPDTSIFSKLSSQIPFWNKTIDLVIATHSDKDHAEGIIELFPRYQINNILWSDSKENSGFAVMLRHAIEKEQEQGTAIFIAKDSQTIRWSSDPDAYGEIIWPSKEAKNTYGSSNELSLVLKFTYGEVSTLFTADIPQLVEYELVEKKSEVISASILKVGHHGAKTSNTEAFIAKVSPKVAIIQVGKENRYGHPHQEVLDRFAAWGVSVLRTDVNGDIVVTSTKTSFAVETQY
ncbi:MAG: MBL fold metallo-hydrolase [Candidatus Wildermuthbacteria bacterium]|nr:MBL fold metallo-hydrolase [Candidatus Wildermuthbacteria bacterium]